MKEKKTAIQMVQLKCLVGRTINCLGADLQLKFMKNTAIKISLSNKRVSQGREAETKRCIRDKDKESQGVKKQKREKAKNRKSE